MAGEDAVVVGKGENAGLKLLYQRGIVAAREVGAADAEMEEGVAREDGLLAVQHEAHAPRAMTGDIAALYKLRIEN